MPTFHRRDFLKALGGLALTCLPACRRAQETAVAHQDCPEWMQVGDRQAFSSCMPWANGAFPLLAACHGGLPTSLQPHPRAAHPGLPAFVQASILDLYDPARAKEPTFAGKSFPWQAMQGALRAWSRALREGRRTGILFPAGWSALRQAQAEALHAHAPGLRCYAWDPVAEPRCTLPDFPELERQQAIALGKPCRWETGFASLAELTRELPQLELLFILCPADPAALCAEFAAALGASEAETLRLHLRGDDRTSALCTYGLPQTHFLEEWGAEADNEGNLCLRQPLTYPLRPALAEEELLHALLHDGELPFDATDTTGHARRFPARALLEKHVTDLHHALRCGILPHAAPRPSPLPPQEAAKRTARLYVHPLRVDGRFSHNTWLRETYDPLSGAAGAPAVFLPGQKAAQGSVQLNGRQLPACRVPGLHTPLLPLLPGVEAKHPIRWQQGHPNALRTPFPAPELKFAEAPTPPAATASPQWGMLIDLAACIGCNACTLACRAENNIPTVGEDEQKRGRDLQWLQLHHYLTPEGRTAFFRPAACRQCEDAPCEKVCPVNATVRTSEGLNAMVYPRCWGTRYCAAACPYNARSFNFLDYARRATQRTPLPPNPQVTVRSRGVMEACTYCVQRLQAGKAAAAVSGQHPSTPAPACAEACPTQAIRLIDLCRDKLPARVLVNFDVPGTRPRTLYVFGNA